MSQEAAKGPTNRKRHTRNTRKTKGRQKQRQKKEEKPNETNNNTREPQTSKQEHSFDTVVEGSDAESKVGQRLSGVPPWETQRECTNELIGSDLAEHEKLGKHP